MKKLFTAMLAATMVAGMSVSAFAEIESASYTTSSFGDNEYAVIGAYDEDGYKIKDNKNSKVDGGDKIYFPILISGDEMDDDRTDGKEKTMFFADKASEVKNLKASVKDEIGGKYIDSAAIVKKDINISKKGTTGVKPVPGVAKVQGEFKVVLEDTTKLVTNVGDTKATVTLDIAGNKVTSAQMDISSSDKEKDAIGAAFNGKTITINSVEYTISATDKTLTFKAPDDKTVTVPANGTAVTLSVTDAGGANVIPATTTSAAKNGVKGVAEVVEEKAIGKIYCVEVKMSDYFKAEETEVEFNIVLKNSGKTEYNTKDDKVDFYATFDLGKDTEMLQAGQTQKNASGKQMVKCKKFKNGNLEILVGKDTRSVQLDEAKIIKGDKEDVTNIYIENDDTIDNAFTFDVKASNQDDLYLELNQDAIKDLAVSNSKADLTFFNFPGKPEFDFTGKATFAVEDDDKDNYFYEIVDGELVESKAKYNKEDGVFELRTNKLGSYVISDKELKVSDGKKEENDTESKEQEGTGGDATVDATTGANGEKGNANTGAADLIGVASALAVVSIAAAGAVALKK